MGQPLMAADLYCDIEMAGKTRPWHYFPGLVVAALATVAAAYFADHYGAPLTLMALLIGLSLNFLGSDPRLKPGLSFASGTMLRIGIILVGARITFEQIGALGLAPFIAVTSIVTVTLLIGVFSSRLLGYRGSFGVLAGGAVAICGGSAALAIYAVLGPRRVREADLALTLIGISTASAFAMFAYPILAHSLGLNDVAAGFVFGASIHDVSQSLGAGFTYSPVAGETATIVKLTRVALLAPVLMLMSQFVNRGAQVGKLLLPPWFVVGFFIVAAVNSLVHVAPAIATAAMSSASLLLASAIAATGMRAPLSTLGYQNFRPVVVIIIASLTSLLLSVIVAVSLSWQASLAAQ